MMRKLAANARLAISKTPALSARWKWGFASVLCLAFSSRAVAQPSCAPGQYHTVFNTCSPVGTCPTTAMVPINGICYVGCTPQYPCPSGGTCTGPGGVGFCAFPVTTPITGQGTVTAGGPYFGGETATVTATPNPGYLFTGFGGALSGTNNPQKLFIDVISPQTVVPGNPPLPDIPQGGSETVTANFTPIPQTTLSAVIASKSGQSNSRVWTIMVTNRGSGTAYFAQLAALMFTHVFGPACTAPPAGVSPQSFPVSLGTIAAGASASAPVTLDFSGCPANAVFAVNIIYTANDGWTGGQTLVLEAR